MLDSANDTIEQLKSELTDTQVVSMLDCKHSRITRLFCLKLSYPVVMDGPPPRWNQGELEDARRMAEDMESQLRSVHEQDGTEKSNLRSGEPDFL